MSIKGTNIKTPSDLHSHKWVTRYSRWRHDDVTHKALDALGNCQIPLFLLGVSQHNMHKNDKSVKILTNLIIWSSKMQGRINKKKKKHHCCANLCAFRSFKKGFSRSLLLFEWEITSFWKAALLQREPFLTMLYAINSSPQFPFINTFSVKKHQHFWSKSKINAKTIVCSMISFNTTWHPSNYEMVRPSAALG